MRQETRFIAKDGTEFRSELECLQHEVEVTLPNGMREFIRTLLRNERVDVTPNTLNNLSSRVLRSRETLVKFFEDYNGTMSLLEVAKKVRDTQTHLVEAINK